MHLFFCQPTNLEEAVEIARRLSANGITEGPWPNQNNWEHFWGTDGVSRICRFGITYEQRFLVVNIQQVRECFPLLETFSPKAPAQPEVGDEVLVSLGKGKIIAFGVSGKTPCAVVQGEDWIEIASNWEAVDPKREKIVSDMVSRFKLVTYPDLPWDELFGQMYDAGVLK